jgi:opacity protein-like surface antigen
MRSILGLALTLAVCAPAPAQEINSGAALPRFEFYAGYLILTHTGPPTFYNFQGFNALNHDGSPAGFNLGLVRPLNRLISIRGDFSGNYDKHSGSVSVPCGQPACTQVSSINPHVYEFMIGPEFTIHATSRVTPFAYALVGIAHATATFNTSGPLGALSGDTAASGLSWAGGGGLSIRLAKRLGSRFSVDYNPAFFGHLDTGARQLVRYVRISTGIVIQ